MMGKFDFISKFPWAGLLSCVLFFLSIIVIWSNFSAQLGLEFTGGNIFTVKTDRTSSEVVKMLNDCGLRNYQVKSVFDDDIVFVRTGIDASSERVRNCLTKLGEILSFEGFSPLISEEIKRKGYLAGVVSLIAMFVYLALRFEKFFALGAVVALFHDIVISLGVYLTLGYSFSLQALVGVLTLVGYSVNDTIIVFDRIREELAKEGSLREIFNRSINFTLGRSIKTSLLTFATVLILIFYGRDAIMEFSVYFLIGIIVGTYSSIFIAAPVTFSLLKHFIKR